MATVAADIESKINTATTAPNVEVTVTVTGESPNKAFLITVTVAGVSNSIGTQVTDTGAALTGLAGVEPVAGTDAKAVDRVIGEAGEDIRRG